jgi:hypothetical protein
MRVSIQRRDLYTRMTARRRRELQALLPKAASMYLSMLEEGLAGNLRAAAKGRVILIRSTFDRRQTSVPVIPPAALTAKFHSEPVHVRQWAAFVRRIGEPALANEFSRVLADLAEFLMPVAKAAATSAEYPVRWELLGPWQHGRSSKI